MHRTGAGRLCSVGPLLLICLVSLLLLGCATGGGVKPEARHDRDRRMFIKSTVITPMTYEAALQRLDAYYASQIRKSQAQVLPVIGPQRHYDVWGDLWVLFHPSSAGLTVTIYGIGLDIDPNTEEWTFEKGVASELAGLLRAKTPPTIQLSHAVASISTEIYAAEKDVLTALPTVGRRWSFVPLPTWRWKHLQVSATSLTRLGYVYRPVQGAMHLHLDGEDLPAAQQLVAELRRATAREGIMTVVPKRAVVDEEIAQEEKDLAGELVEIHQRTGASLPPGEWVKQQVRTRPHHQAKLTQSVGRVVVTCRLDAAYQRVSLRWLRLVGDVTEQAADERHELLAETTPSDVHGSSDPTQYHEIELELSPLPPGNYQLILSWQQIPGLRHVIDQRRYAYDGEIFTEF